MLNFLRDAADSITYRASQYARNVAYDPITAVIDGALLTAFASPIPFVAMTGSTALTVWASLPAVGHVLSRYFLDEDDTLSAFLVGITGGLSGAQISLAGLLTSLSIIESSPPPEVEKVTPQLVGQLLTKPNLTVSDSKEKCVTMQVMGLDNRICAKVTLEQRKDNGEFVVLQKDGKGKAEICTYPANAAKDIEPVPVRCIAKQDASNNNAATDAATMMLLMTTINLNLMAAMPR